MNTTAHDFVTVDMRGSKAALVARAQAERVSVSVPVLLGVVRVRRALWVNERYWFTTWRWGKVLAALLLVGTASKLVVGH